MVSGSCLCGRFAFEVEGPFQYMGNCHCTYCRKSHGTAFATFVGAPAAGFRWRKGDGEQSHYQSSPSVKRMFCPTCGSKLPGEAHGDTIYMPAGLLDGDPEVRPQAHFFTRSRAVWFEITDGVPTFDGMPPGMETPDLPTPARSGKAHDGAVAGSCLCGTVAWEFTGMPPRMGFCHCSRCRKTRSAAFSSQIFVPIDAFQWLAGEDKIVSYKLPESRFFGSAFCGTCAGPVPRTLSVMGMMALPAGSLDDDPVARPMAHIFVGSKAPWYEIPKDNLIRFEEMPPSM